MVLQEGGVSTQFLEAILARAFLESFSLRRSEVDPDYISLPRHFLNVTDLEEEKKQ